MSSLARLMELSSGRGPGPSPSFTPARFLLAFLIIGETGTVGRQALAKKAGLGEGAVRTVLKMLREGGYAATRASGCYLTSSGTAIFKELRRKLSPVASLGASELTVGRSQRGVSIRNGARRVRRGIEQRDAAVKAGASGATTYIIKAGRFTIPGGSTDCESDYPSSAWKILRKELEPSNGDAVILCGSDDSMNATMGALSAALTLL